MKKQLNTTLIYVLSIFGLLCCCFGGFGFLLSGYDDGFETWNELIQEIQNNQ
jgi:hypothetical protein